MIAWLLGELWPWIGGALAGGAALLAAVMFGKRSARQAGENQALERKVKTWERINEADTSTADDVADREWLRKRGQRRGDL